MLAVGDMEGHADRAEADPGIEPLREARPLRQGPQGIEPRCANDPVGQGGLCIKQRQIEELTRFPNVTIR